MSYIITTTVCAQVEFLNIYICIYFYKLLNIVISCYYFFNKRVKIWAKSKKALILHKKESQKLFADFFRLFIPF